MSISQDMAAKVLARSARHCCLCRNFCPLAIQVHHITEKNEGGGDEFDNLIPLCIQCHSFVHSKTAMTRPITRSELKLHRDEVYALVAAGKLPASKPLTAMEVHAISANIAETLRQQKDNGVLLEQDEIELLVAAVCEQSPVVIGRSGPHRFITIGHQNFFPREWGDAQYPPTILTLLGQGMLTAHGDELTITDRGLNYVASAAKTTASYTLKKVKCFACGLHFIIHTYYDDRHNSSNIYCPECGQHEGFFLVWVQKQIGFIFNQVPGSATIYDMRLPPKTESEAASK